MKDLRRKKQISRCEASAQPCAIGLKLIKQAIVKATGPGLPKLDALRPDTVTTPIFRPVNCSVAILPFNIRIQLFEEHSVRYNFALW